MVLEITLETNGIASLLVQTFYPVTKEYLNAIPNKKYSLVKQDKFTEWEEKKDSPMEAVYALPPQ